MGLRFKSFELSGYCFCFLLIMGLTWASRVSALPKDLDLQQCRLDVLTVRDGLPARAITSIAQTPDGYIWLATTAGLVRYDGSSFEIYNTSNCPGLKSNLVRQVFVDRSGVLWVGTEWGGFGTFSNGRFNEVRLQSKGWQRVWGFSQDPAGTIWMGQNGIPRVLCVRNGHAVAAPKVTWVTIGIAQAPQGGLLVASVSDGLWWMHPNGDVGPYVPQAMLPSPLLTAVCRASDNAVWCGTQRDGLCRIVNGRVRKFNVQSGLSSNSINCIYEDKSRRIWVGTTDGIDWWDGNRFHSLSKTGGLYNSNVQAILDDKEGNLWVASGIGLNRFSATKLIPFSLTNGTLDSTLDAFGSVAASNDGEVWCATDFGLWKLTSHSMERYSMADGLPAPYFDCVSTDTHGNIQLLRKGASQHATLFSVDRLSLVRHHAKVRALGHADDFSLGVAGHGDTQVAGGEIVQITKQGLKKLAPSLVTYAFAAKQDSDGNVWIGSDHGLVRYAHGRASLVDAGLPDGTHVLGLDVSDRGSVWMATDKGLGWFHGNKSVMLGAQSGIPDTNIFQIINDGLGRIWMGSNAGIFSARIRDIQDWLSGRLKEIPWAIYSASDGIKSFPDTFNAVRTNDGMLWFAGAKGLTMVDPRHLRTNPVPPPVSIESAIANGAVLDEHHKTIVEPGTGALHFQYAALSYSAPENIRYRYRLLGFDQTWTEVQRKRTVDYTNVPPGSYRFVVLACNCDGVWNLTGASVSFELKPHYYETTWFKLAVIVFMFAATFMLASLRSRAIIRRNRELEQKVADRTAKLASQNEELKSMQGELEAQNDELQGMQSELEAQNEELIETQQRLAGANAMLENLATTDALTGLKNRRSFADRYQAEWDRALRDGSPLSVVLMDVDKFKQYNDTYGHAGGDDVLRRVARILSEQARDGDLVARYGGEEFIVLAARTDGDGAMQLAERLRAAIETAEWPARAVTASFGVASLDLEIANADELIELADAALYESKNRGRNRVTHARDLREASPIAKEAA